MIHERVKVMIEKPFLSEIYGRTALGQGALSLQVYELYDLPIPDLNRIPKSLLNKIKKHLL